MLHTCAQFEMYYTPSSIVALRALSQKLAHIPSLNKLKNYKQFLNFNKLK